MSSSLHHTMTEFDPVILSSSSLTLEILPYGLTIDKFLVKGNDKIHDIVIGPEDPKEHLQKKYTNTIVGRYANRIPVGTHELERNGIKSVFVAQANENPRVSLHGGPIGFDAIPWEPLIPSKPPTLFSEKELSHFPRTESATSYVVFRLKSPDGDQGYPGELTVEVLFALLDPDAEDSLGSLIYVYRAKLDKGVTPVNLTQHWGFNLDASLGAGPESIRVGDHVLTIKSDKIVSRDQDSLHTGDYISVSSAPAHAHDGKKIKDGYPEGGYDDFYVFGPQYTTSKGPKRVPFFSLGSGIDLVQDIVHPKEKSSLVEIASDKSGLRLVFDSNQSGVMFYSNGLADAKNGSRKKIHSGTGPGDSYAPGGAAFLEFHEVLTAFLDPSNKDKDDTLLTSDELYHNYVRCDVKFKAPTL